MSTDWAKRGVAMAVAWFAILATSCSGDTNYLTADKAIAEYRDEAGRLTLAPGWRWPADLRGEFPQNNPDGSVNRYQINRGRVGAAIYWNCSWGRTFLTGEPSQREMALPEIRQVRNSAIFKWGLVGKDKAYWDQVLRDFDNGKYTEYRQIVEASCPAGSA